MNENTLKMIINEIKIKEWQNRKHIKNRWEENETECEKQLELLCSRYKFNNTPYINKKVNKKNLKKPKRKHL